MASSSFSSSSLCRYFVFLSFRGADTRKTFVSFLDKELVRNGILTFKDDKELESGSSISPELLRAIEESKFAIVVMSESYASSGWCLEELAKIMECHEKGTLKAIPVFYGVEPSDVRRQTGKFAQHMEKHERRENPEKVKCWRDALTKLADLSGECSREDDSELVDKIVKDILNRFISDTPSDFSGLVGMDVHMKAMYKLLGLEPNNEVRVIGICGMGGIGKTTLARYVYEKISGQFQTPGFLENVKKIYQDGGPSRLQEELLSKTNGRALTVGNSYLGSNVIRATLGHRKVLLVLDDVDKIEQLNVVANELSWFGPGSRVIVTTRDQRLLDKYRPKFVYEVECLKESEAFRLFCKHAFEQECPPSSFEQLSARAINLAGGLPLAIKVFGSRLYFEKEEKDWEAVLDKLKRSPNKDVMEILKVSYDGLDEECKSIFYWVACLFNGKHIDHVTGLLNDNRGPDARHEINVLVRRSLIVISRYGDITMHDLVQQMGRELVCQESPREPGKRMLLWKPDDIHGVLAYRKGTEAIEGISLDVTIADDLTISNGAFENMPNLKYLRIRDMRFYLEFITGERLWRENMGSLPPSISFSPKLRYLEWQLYPLKTLQFRPESLVELDLQGSKLEKLWEGSPDLRNLKKINLMKSLYLNEFPDLSNAPNLELIDASFCESLIEIPSTVCGLNKLTMFKLGGCCRLERIPNNMDMESLQSLVLNECSNLKVFPQFSCGIQHLFLSRGRQRELPESIGYLLHLEGVHLNGFELLENLPDTIGNLTALKYLNLDNCHGLQRIPDTIGKLTALEYLYLDNCHGLQRIPDTIGNLTALEDLRLDNCHGLQTIPDTIGNLTALMGLCLDNCHGLHRIPDTIGNLTALKYLNLDNCHGLQRIPDTIGNLTALEDLCLDNCHRLQRIPDTIGKLTALESLNLVNCHGLQRIPDTIGNLTGLMGLRLDNCHGLQRILDTIGNLTCLKYLYLNNCHRLQRVPDTMDNLTALEDFRLDNCHGLQRNPDTIGNLTSLRDLCLDNCHGLRRIPDTIGNLTALSNLCLDDCHRLQRIPNTIRNMISLRRRGLYNPPSFRKFQK